MAPGQAFNITPLQVFSFFENFHFGIAGVFGLAVYFRSFCLEVADPYLKNAGFSVERQLDLLILGQGGIGDTSIRKRISPGVRCDPA